MQKNKKGISDKQKQAFTAYVFILPTIVVFTVFVIIPLIDSISVSFFNWSFYLYSDFVGFDNYIRLLRNNRFWASLLVAFRFLAIILPCQLILSFLLAHVIKNIFGRFASFVKTSIFMPYIIAGVTASLLFSFIYNFQGGLLNSVLVSFGFDRVAWLANPGIVMFSVALPVIWISLGYSTLLMLAGLNDIPQVYFEIASIDGANFLRRIWHVTLPQMKNLFVFMIITNVTAVLQLFDVPMMLTEGGPMDLTNTPILFIYQRFMRDPNLNFSIAASLLIFILLGSISALIFRTINSEKMSY